MLKNQWYLYEQNIQRNKYFLIRKKQVKYYPKINPIVKLLNSVHAFYNKDEINNKTLSKNNLKCLPICYYNIPENRNS